MAKTSKVNFKIVPGAKWVPSNKQQPPGISPSKDDLASVSGDDEPTPFIDKLSVVWKPPTPEKAKEIFGMLLADIGHSKDIYKYAGWSKSAGRTRILLDAVDDVKKCPFLQWKHDEKSIAQLRIEFVPVDLGFSGIAELHAILKGFLEDGWHSFVKAGKITRLDVAIDFPHVEMDQLLFLPRPLATTKRWSQNGKLQTFTQGSSKGNQWRIYDRKAKRKAQGKAWQGKTGIRIERKLKSSSPLIDLPALKNPFLSLSVIEKMPSCPVGEKKTYIWNLFQCAIEERGLAGALALLPEDKRQLYADHFTACSAPWWSPDEIWLNWKHMLHALDLAHPTKWN